MTPAALIDAIEAARRDLRKAISTHAAAARQLKQAQTNSKAREAHMAAALAVTSAATRLAGHLAAQRAAHTLPQFAAVAADLASLQIIAARTKAFGGNIVLKNLLDHHSPFSDLDELAGFIPDAVPQAKAQVESLIRRLQTDPNANF